MNLSKLRSKLREVFQPTSQRPSGEVRAGGEEAGSLSNNTADGEPSTYSSDQPIASRAEDRFNRWPFAERIAETVARREDPSSLVIGIYGIWGDGKTSTLRLMTEALKAHPHAVVVRFNPWHFESEAQLLRGFFSTLSDALGRALPTWKEDLGSILDHYGAILSLASVSILGGLAQISPGEGLREIGKQLSTVELEDLKIRLERILKESGKRVVVLIDDIDRLDRQEVQAIFKLVKLSAGFELTVYVLAFDDDVVADALGEKYGAGGSEAGRGFLEKIVQVPLHLPPADQLSLRKLAFEGAEAALRLSNIELKEDQAQAFVRHFIDGLEVRLTTPRQAKRYANALAFALPILKREVHPVDQMLIEGIRLFYPRLYVTIREDPDTFLKAGRERAQDEARTRAREVIDRGLDGLDAKEKEAAKDVLTVLFPRVKGILGNTRYGSDWDQRWAREQRICSEEYFHRYFRYGVPPGDVPDESVADFLEKGAAGDEAILVDTLREFAEHGAMPRLVLKLRMREESIGPGTARLLALVLARNASMLPREKTMFGFDSTFSQAAIFVMKLVRQIPAGAEREDLTRQLINEAQPLRFGFECFRWLRADEKEPENERVIPTTVEEELGRIVAKRVKEAAAGRPPYIEVPEDSPALFWIWQRYGGPGEVSSYLEARFATDAREVLALLVTYVPTAWGVESGLPHRSDLRRDSYDAIVELVNPEVVIRHLKDLFGAGIEAAEYYVAPELPVEERGARQFAALHREISQAKKSPEPGPSKAETS